MLIKLRDLLNRRPKATNIVLCLLAQISAVPFLVAAEAQSEVGNQRPQAADPSTAGVGNTAPGLDKLVAQAVTQRLELQSGQNWIPVLVSTFIGGFLGGIGGFGLAYLKKRAELAVVNQNFKTALDQFRQQTEQTENIKTTALPAQTKAVEAARQEFIQQGEEFRKQIQIELTHLNNQVAAMQSLASVQRQDIGAHQTALVSSAIQIQAQADIAIKMPWICDTEIQTTQRSMLTELATFRLRAAMLRGIGGIDSEMRSELESCAARIATEWDTLMDQWRRRSPNFTASHPNEPTFDADAYKQICGRLAAAMVALVQTMEKLPSKTTVPL